jgi:hypothetical protein
MNISLRPNLHTKAAKQRPLAIGAPAAILLLKSFR